MDTLSQSELKNDIQNLIKEHVSVSLARKVNNLFDALRNECFFEPPNPSRDIVYLNNMTLKVSESGIYETKDTFTLNRLSVDYNEGEKSPIWDKFLSSLFEEEDIITLQEYIGYCLVPYNHSTESINNDRARGKVRVL